MNRLPAAIGALRQPWFRWAAALGLALLTGCSGQDEPMPSVGSAHLGLAGADADRNGVRDDVDATLARLTATRPGLRARALALAQTEQALLDLGNATARSDYLTAARCSGVPEAVADALSTALLATPAQRARQASLLAGAAVPVGGCDEPLASQAAVTPVLYVNSVSTSLAQAMADAKALAAVLDASRLHQAAPRTFAVTLVYNPLGWGGGVGVGGPHATQQDAQETFLLKTAEEHHLTELTRLLLAHDSLAPQMEVSAAVRVLAYLDDMTPGENSLEATGAVDDVGMASAQAAARALSAQMATQPGAIVVAHGEGNLLANLAWAERAAQSGNAIAAQARVVNVGNAARLAINRLDLTHAGDRAVRVQLAGLPYPRGNWTGATRTTPDCSGSYCAFQSAEPTFDAGSGPALAHGFRSFYLSEASLPTPLQDWGVPYTPGAVAARDRLEDLVYAAAASMQRLTLSYTSRVPHSGVQADDCMGLGVQAPVPCASASAVAYSGAGRQDGMNVLVNPKRYAFVPNPAGGHFDRTECIQDEITGLMWEGKTASGVRAGSNRYTRFSGPGTAHEYVDIVNASGLCGHSDWRLPIAAELMGLLNFDWLDRPTATHAYWLPNTAEWDTWTSPADRYHSGAAWTVDFLASGTRPRAKQSLLAVRLVRGGPPADADRYTYSADGSEVTDTVTGLTWRRCPEGKNWDGGTCSGQATKYTLHGAMAHALTQPGWRVPHIGELLTLVIRTQDFATDFGPTIDRTAFPDTGLYSYWSSTQYSRLWDAAQTVNFKFGINETNLCRECDQDTRLRLVRAQ
ncbi:MAG: DUF1566 domain-containing protein [Proteobacteria bacterium]|nr:DUF1566 domain-containing protein [Pseudomonadota bacterium]